MKPESSEKQVKLVEPSKDDEDDDSSDQVFGCDIVEQILLIWMYMHMKVLYICLIVYFNIYFLPVFIT